MLRLTNAQLRARGVPAREVTALRMEMTGHPRSMDALWQQSIGLWGGVYNATEIGFILGVSTGRVHAHARGCGLKVARRGKEQEACILAALLYLHRDDPGMAQRRGLLEVERRRYILEVEAILGEGASLAGVKSAAWRSAWAKNSRPVMATGLPADMITRRKVVDERRVTLVASADRARGRASVKRSSRRWGRRW